MRKINFIMSFLLLVLTIACGKKASTGSVTGISLANEGVVAVVKMDDGREVNALMPANSGGMIEVVGGQRVQVEPLPNSKLWRVVRILDEKKAQGGSSPAEPFEVAVKSNTKQQQWTLPEGSTGISITKGAAAKFIDSDMSGFKADPGYDIAVVTLEIAINAADANLPMEKAVALDAAGKEYGNLGDPAPLGKGNGQRRQFAFAVPAGTELAEVRLANGYTLKLAGSASEIGNSVAGGVPGGIEGGVEGGVTGGVMGSEEGEAPVEDSRQAIHIAQQPKKIREVAPVYSQIALAARIHGEVIIEVMADIYGHVSQARVISGHPLLNDAALTAIKQWVYEPYILNGIPKPVIFTATVIFTLQNQ